MNAKEHYDSHLGNFYSWMLGDLPARQEEVYDFFLQHNIVPAATKVAIDLGAGNGLHTVPLAWLGFHVIAIDFNMQLLTELSHNAAGFNVDVVSADIRNVSYYANRHPELITCMGDTLAHLDSMDDVETLIKDCTGMLAANGRLVLSFRDYSIPLEGDARLIHVRSDDNRRLTSFLEYGEQSVKVTDILYERNGDTWQQKESSYTKVRLSPAMVTDILQQQGMDIIFRESIAGMHTIITSKKAM